MAPVLEKFFHSLTKKTDGTPVSPAVPPSSPAVATPPAPAPSAPPAQKLPVPPAPAAPAPQSPLAPPRAQPAPVPAPPPPAVRPAPSPLMPGAPIPGRMPVPAMGTAAVAAAVKAPEPAGPVRNTDISLYKNLLAGLYDGVLIFDAKGAVIGSNQRAEQYLGYTSRDLWGLQCEELVVGINARLLYKLRANAEAGRFTVVNGNCKRKDGSTFPAEIAISRIHLLNDGDFIFSIHNVERREKVRETREMSHEAIRSAGAGIVVCNQEGAIEFVNPAFLKILRVEDEQDVLKRLIADFCSSYETVFAMLHAPSTQGTWLGVLKLNTAKGGTCEVMVTSALSQEKRGAEPRLVLTLTPIPKSIA
jgi:PAS domain S-box-containing protein